MKIEIEFEEVERLKRSIEVLQREKGELETKLKSLNESELKKQATSLAMKIFHDVMNRVFEKLGFEGRMNPNEINFSNLEHYLGKSWYTSERLHIELGATITDQFRCAFLSMGIKDQLK